MKKLQKLVSFALVGALAFSLAACGNDGSKGGKEETDGAPDPSTIQCESVTAEQWAAAFDISEYTNATARVFQRVSVGGQRSDMTSVAPKREQSRTSRSESRYGDQQDAARNELCRKIGRRVF